MAKTGLEFLQELMKVFPESTARDVRSGLNTSSTARYGRAADQGFDTANPKYHWTNADIQEFVPSESGKYGRGIYMLDDPSSGMKYAAEKGGNLNVMPLLTRGDIADKDAVHAADAWVRQNVNIEKSPQFSNNLWNAISDRLESQGFSGLNYGGETVIFNPKDVRSTMAMYSPKSTDSGALSAGLGALGVGGLLGMQSQDAEAGGLGVDDLMYLAKQAMDGNKGAATVLGREGLDATSAMKKAEEMMSSQPKSLLDVPKEADLSYRGSHVAPDAEYGAPLYDVTDMIPEDIYGSKGIQYYGIGDPTIDKETFDVLRAARGKPDMEVPIFRAVPQGVKDINAGDWVTTSREYARRHGENALGGKYDILESTAPAKKLQTEGYPYEFGLLPALGGLAVGLTPEDAMAMGSGMPAAMQAAGQSDLSGQANLGRELGTALFGLDMLLPLVGEAFKPAMMGNAELTDEQRRRGYFRQGLLD